MESESVGFKLHVLNNCIKRYFDFSSRMKTVDEITGNNGWIIGYLAHNADRDIFQKNIEEHFDITRSTVSKVLRLMEEKKLIEKHSVPEDARLKKIVLTKKAWEAQELMMNDIGKMEQALLSGFSESEIDTMFGYLDRMKNNISNIAEK
jgi:Transcriptional regulators